MLRIDVAWASRFDRLLRIPGMKHSAIFASVLILFCLFATTTSAQDRRWAVFGESGFASIGHADSEQGKAPIVGGGAAFQITSWMVAEGDVHAARVQHVFGRDHHDFTEVTFTGSLLYRSSAERRVHFIAGGGLALQRAHIEFDLLPIGHVDRTESLRLLHGRSGLEWDISNRVVIRTDAALWFGAGVDWVLGGRVGVGYRF